MIRTSGLVLALLASAPGAMSAQPADAADPVIRATDALVPAAVPFGLGERARYKVRLGIIGTVGEGRLEISELDTIRGRPSYHLHMSVKGGIPFARVDTKYDSWLDVNRLVSLRFRQDQDEVNYERKRTFDFFPEQRRWEMSNGETGTLPTDMPLDELSFIYFARTLPLVVGETYSFNRYFQDDGNPVELRVLRTERVTVPAGTFETIVVRPVIRSKGLFSEGGEAEVYFTNDDRRILVMLRSKVKILKSLDMLLESYTPGAVIAPRSTTPQ